MLGSLISKGGVLQVCSIFKKKTPKQVSFVDIKKYLRLPILKSICERLLLGCFNGSLSDSPKVSISILYDSVRIQG